MRHLFKFITIIVILSISASVYSQDKDKFPEGIVKATQEANCKTLATFFNEKIELIIPGKSGVYSKAQAEQVIKVFFENHPVTSFKIIHKGIKDNSSFAIGKYISNNINYRFYYRIKNSEGKTLIHQIWIDKEDE
ncbi:MAG: DUF4783 domain-containing protein [Marinilabiliaceae bacterium]|nr:DUF4783 domain-containing protein [Marinilabiliaceae bacterium]